MLHDLRAEKMLWTTDVIARFEQALGTWATQGSKYARSLHHRLSGIQNIGDKREYILNQILPRVLNGQGEGQPVSEVTALRVLIQTWLQDNGLAAGNRS